MSRQELIAKMEMLSPDDYNMIVMLIDRLSEHTDNLRTLTEDELVAELSQSIARSDQGFTKPARQVSEEMRQKYAV